MHTTLVVLLVFGVIAVIFLTMGSDAQARRRHALQSLSKLLGAPLESMVGEENSFRIFFKYQGRECTYEDTEEKGFKGQIFRRGILKVKTAVKLTIGFSERDSATVKENVETFADISNPWAQNVGRLSVPKALERFNVFTNNNQLVNMLFTDEVALKTFERFKNVDSRGPPVMSLEVFDGVLGLKFHSAGGLNPSLVNFHGNVSSIEEYLSKISVLAEKIEAIERDIKARNI